LAATYHRIDNLEISLMKTRLRSALSAAIMCCVAVGVGSAYAADQSAAHEHATAPGASAGTGRSMSGMQQSMPDMQKMREQMAAIRAAKDPAARAKLMEEHLQTMESAMQAMESGGGCKMMQQQHADQTPAK
jgi:hypothetical protein